MTIGKMRERIKILEFVRRGNKYAWAQKSLAWAHREKKEKNNIFSKIGIGAETSLFAIRKCGLTLHNAIEHDGRHYYITDITDNKSGFFDVLTALVRVVHCKVYRTAETLSAVNTPIVAKELVFECPACMTEKYMGWAQREPMAVIEHTMVLIVPAAISLHVGDIAEIGAKKYAVTVCHELGEISHEYEIELREDA